MDKETHDKIWDETIGTVYGRYNNLVKINKIEDTVCHLFYEDENGKEVIGVIDNILQLNDVRIQIKEKNAEGYYIIWVDEKYTNQTYRLNIHPDGIAVSWPKGFFDLLDKQLEKLTSF